MLFFSVKALRYSLLVFGFLFCFIKGTAGDRPVIHPIAITKYDTLIVLTNGSSDLHGRPNPVLQMFKAKQKKNKKITAALLAFPFPFGICGLHRIYLGTAPYIPVVYIGTLGGVFGILPFIDFCVLVLDKDVDRYIENKNVLMWVQENAKPAK